MPRLRTRQYGKVVTFAAVLASATAYAAGSPSATSEERSKASPCSARA